MKSTTSVVVIAFVSGVVSDSAAEPFEAILKSTASGVMALRRKKATFGSTGFHAISRRDWTRTIGQRRSIRSTAA